MFERFTERARQVVVLAQEEARTLKHNYIGTEHILLGLLREEEGLAARVLESFDITVERVRAHWLAISWTSSGEEITSGQIPFTRHVERVLDLALREALSLGHNYIDTEHILLALAAEDEALFLTLDSDADSAASTTWSVKIRKEVIRMLSGRARRAAELAEPAQSSRTRADTLRVLLSRVEALAGSSAPKDRKALQAICEALSGMVPEGFAVEYIHERRRHGWRGRWQTLPTGGSTTAVLTRSDGLVIWPHDFARKGTARCNPSDNFDKRVGRALALGRALQDL